VCPCDSGPADPERRRPRRPAPRFLVPRHRRRVRACGDDRTLSGPAVIAVTQKTDPLPCQLATQTCAAQSGLLACVGDLYANDGACGTTARTTSSRTSPRCRCRTTTPPLLRRVAALHRAGERGARRRRRATATSSCRSCGRACSPPTRAFPCPPGAIPTRVAAALRVPIRCFSSPTRPRAASCRRSSSRSSIRPSADPDVVTVFGRSTRPTRRSAIARRHGTCVGRQPDGSAARAISIARAARARTPASNAPATLCSTARSARAAPAASSST
jgi:hypothetical protein